MKNLPLIIAVVSVIIALVALTVSLTLKQQTATTIPNIASTKNIDTTPTKQTIKNNILSGVIDVVTLNERKETYAGKKIVVSGEIQINPRYGEMPCPANEPTCETIMGIDLYLMGKPLKPNMGNIIRIYKDGKPYPCSKKGKNFVCGNFRNGEMRTVAGIWIKSREPAQTVGNSSGSYQVLKWRDFFYLEVDQ